MVHRRRSTSVKLRACAAKGITNHDLIKRSLLRYPLDVRSYRCTICDTIHDLFPIRGVYDPAYAQPLNENIISEARNNPTELSKWIDIGFGYWENLNASFLNGEEINLENSGVDLSTLGNVYWMIGETLNKMLVAAMERVLRRPGRPLQQKDDVQFLWTLFAVQLSAKAPDSKYTYDIFARLIGVISNLDNGLHHYWVHWFSRLPEDAFRSRVETLNMFITYRLTVPVNQDPSAPYQSYANDWRVAAVAANNLSKVIPIFAFYNTMADFIDLVADYDSWQQAFGDFSFCQYPFLLSMGAKMRILELDAKRQMERKLKEAMYSFLIQRKVVVPYLLIRVRRDHLMEDSLNQLTGKEYELKKKLRIEFLGEPGIDAGGLTKEWFLLLVREVFSVHYGMFSFEEETNYFWFSPSSLEASDQFYLIIGLAIYNSTILDVQLPLACYKKLLGVSVGLDDLATLVRGLREMLEYEGNVEETYCRDFVVEYESYGHVVRVELIEHGATTPVTNDNRKLYVEKYVDWVLNTSIQQQFEPFQRGFNLVCGGNALSLFRPEEMELVIRGSAEPLQIDELRAATVYEGFSPHDAIIDAFWYIWKSQDLQMQRNILMFVTGSDRVPAFGSASMTFKITLAGEDCNRYPQAHTCFNQLLLYRYRSSDKLKRMLLQAVVESEGFGLK